MVGHEPTTTERDKATESTATSGRNGDGRQAEGQSSRNSVSNPTPRPGGTGLQNGDDATDGCCWECSVRGELEEATIFDTSGGAYLQLCRWCRSVFERRHNIYQSTVFVRCSRHRDPSRADGLKFFNADNNEALHVCDNCRLKLLGMTVGGTTAAGQTDAEQERRRARRDPHREMGE